MERAHILAMIAVPFLILLIAILFPRFTRFVFTLFAFGALFVVASCIDHAKAAEPSETMMKNAISFANCTRGNAMSEPDKLHQIKMLGGDAVGALVMSCDVLVDSYVHSCQASGYAEDHCYSDLRVIADDMLKQNVP